MKDVTILQRYDTKNEYKIRTGDLAECERSYLSESMPVPSLPESAEFKGVETVDQINCEHWVSRTFGDEKVDIYVTEAGKLPYQVITSYHDGETQQDVPLMTYKLHNLTLQVANDVFELPAPYLHKTCRRKIGGSPYIHLFHSFLMV